VTRRETERAVGSRSLSRGVAAVLRWQSDELVLLPLTNSVFLFCLERVLSVPASNPPILRVDGRPHDAND
jgi:hypothetical protein